MRASNDSSTGVREAGVELRPVATHQVNRRSAHRTVRAARSERGPRSGRRTSRGGRPGAVSASAARGNGRASAGLLTIGESVPSKSDVTSRRAVAAAVSSARTRSAGSSHRRSRIPRVAALLPTGQILGCSPSPMSSRIARSSRLLTSVAEARRVNQASRFDSQTSEITRAMWYWSSVGLALAHRAGEHRVHQLADVIDLTRGRRVGEHERARHGLGQQRVALHGAVEPADHHVEPLVRGAACQRRAIGLGVDALELAAERRHQEVHLRREVPYSVPTATSARSATARI